MALKSSRKPKERVREKLAPSLKKQFLPVSNGNVETSDIAPLLTIPEVACILHLSRVQVYRLINKGQLPTVKIEGARRVRPADLKLWIDQLTA